MRLDSTFYGKEVLSVEQKILEKDYTTFGDLIKVLTDYTANGSFASLAKNVNVSDDRNYAKWIRIQNLDEMDYEHNIKYVDESSYDFLKKSKLEGKELLISKTGEYLGKAYVFNHFGERCTLADNIFLIRLKNNQMQNYIYTYINSKMGRNEIVRWNQGTGQPTIIKESLRNIKVPILSEAVLGKINELIDDYFTKSIQGKDIYKKAKALLENSVGVNENEKYLNINIKKKSESFDITSRLDAEYYQMKYDILFDKLNSNNNQKLRNLVNYTKSIEPGTMYYRDSGIPFIRVSNLNENKISETKLFLDKNDFGNLEELYIKKDTILLSKDGSIGIAYHAKKDMDMVTSGAILHLRVKDPKIILPSYLTMVLNSNIVKLQAERDSNGAIIQHWKPSEIENVIIPILDMDVQKEIAEKAEEASKLNEEAERLFNLATKMVELSIEYNEEKALDYYNKQIGELK